MQKEIEKSFFVFDIIASLLVVLNSLDYADNACHWQAMCWQTVLGICLLLKETFSNATTFKVINESFKGAAIQIPTEFRPICHVVFLKVLWNTAL